MYRIAGEGAPHDAMLVATDAWKAAFPGAAAGVLVLRDVANPPHAAALEARKRELEQTLRNADPSDNAARVLGAYDDYYRAHGQTYHVRAQRASVAVKGKPIPSRAALVEAMFMAELASCVLTAGHDLSALEPPLTIDVTQRGDTYVLLNGKTAELRDGDMKMADGRGIVSSILRGPDDRTRITPQTRDVVFAAYAAPGIDARVVERHLGDLRANVLLIAPDARTETLATVTAD